MYMYMYKLSDSFVWVVKGLRYVTCLKHSFRNRSIAPHDNQVFFFDVIFAIGGLNVFLQ